MKVRLAGEIGPFDDNEIVDDGPFYTGSVTKNVLIVASTTYQGVPPARPARVSAGQFLPFALTPLDINTNGPLGVNQLPPLAEHSCRQFVDIITFARPLGVAIWPPLTNISGSVGTTGLPVTELPQTVPLTYAPETDLATTFRGLLHRWQQETMFLSSTTAIVMCDPYQQIIGMGTAALPFIFAQLRAEGDDPGSER